MRVHKVKAKPGKRSVATIPANTDGTTIREKVYICCARAWDGVSTRSKVSEPSSSKALRCESNKASRSFQGRDSSPRPSSSFWLAIAIEEYDGVIGCGGRREEDGLSLFQEEEEYGGRDSSFPDGGLGKEENGMMNA